MRRSVLASVNASVPQSVSKSVNDSMPDSVPDSVEEQGKEGNRDQGTSTVRLVDADFEAFWVCYPRKVGKRAALSKFRALRPDLKKCLAAVEQQKQSDQWRKEGGRFIPHPATWLGQGRWDDVAQRDFENEAEVPGWRELLGEAEPELSLPMLWGQLDEWARSYARQLYNEKHAA